MSLFPDASPYRVLARKYRPSAFDALIGQDAMVQTLANAIATGRLAQAWLLTGVRGVGKTSTARIIAKCLNCVGPDGAGGPTIRPCGVCANCVAIAAGNHMDVIEIDAASNTGVDNIREIIEAVRYTTASARTKFYIIDEVHMLSKGAFNALLKTLEEPPAHVKFVLATTEVQKVPATILSRCQRFDLKRVPVERLERHFAEVAAAEGVAADADALALIARAAEGSVRDGLSILDQAIAMAGAGPVRAEAVRGMLGLADRGQLAGLMDLVLAADAPGALAALDEAHRAGVEPMALMAGLLDWVHWAVRARMAGAADPALGEADRERVERWAGLSFPALHRLWQLLLKGHAEVRDAPDMRQAADMAVLRAVHAAGLPDPEAAARLLAGQPATDAQPAVDAQPAPDAPPAAGTPPAGPAPDPVPGDAAALVALFAGREPMLAKLLSDDAVILEVAPGRLRLAAAGPLPAGFAAELRRRLAGWTQCDWTVTLEPRPEGAETLRRAGERSRADLEAAALADPAVAAMMAAFPGARLADVRPGPPERRQA